MMSLSLTRRLSRKFTRMRQKMTPLQAWTTSWRRTVTSVLELSSKIIALNRLVASLSHKDTSHLATRSPGFRELPRSPSYCWWSLSKPRRCRSQLRDVLTTPLESYQQASQGSRSWRPSSGRKGKSHSLLWERCRRRGNKIQDMILRLLLSISRSTEPLNLVDQSLSMSLLTSPHYTRTRTRHSISRLLARRWILQRERCSDAHLLVHTLMLFARSTLSLDHRAHLAR